MRRWSGNNVRVRASFTMLFKAVSRAATGYHIVIYKYYNRSKPCFFAGGGAVVFHYSIQYYTSSPTKEEKRSEEKS